MSNWNKNNTMRSNLKEFELKKPVTKYTPLWTRMWESLEHETPLSFQGKKYVVVDFAPVKGSNTDMFFLQCL